MEKFGKLENGMFVQYHFIQTETSTIYTEDETIWFDNGYKKLVDNKPEDIEGYYWSISYEETGLDILIIYTAVENQIMQ